jgi:hypothetical protein
MELFGTLDMSKLDPSKLRSLRRKDVELLDKKKLKSLSKKYTTIPGQYLPYFPAIPEDGGDDDELDDDIDGAVVDRPRRRQRDDEALVAEAPAGAAAAGGAGVTATTAKKSKVAKAPGSRPPGRPIGAVAPRPSGSNPSILAHFAPRK